LQAIIKNTVISLQKSRPTLKTALCNIVNYNKILTQLTQKEEMSVEDMVKIHELTYTLENALGKLSEDLAKAAVDLEEVHLASEKLDTGLSKNSQIFMQISQQHFLPNKLVASKSQKSKVKSQKSKV
jgi:hypothetical protein